MTTTSRYAAHPTAANASGCAANGGRGVGQEAALVSVIVLNYNGEAVIRRCIEALLAQSYPNTEIVIVDNNSSDRSPAIAREYLTTGRVTLVHSARNRGVPGGRNLGLLHAQGKIIAFIDNDGYAHPDWLSEGVRTLLSEERIGAVASVVFFARNTLVLNGAGGTLNWQGYGGDLCFNAPYEFAAIPEQVLYPMGCGMIIRRSILDLIGEFDSRLFNYYDDADLGIRIWRSGYTVVVSPRAQVDHDFSYTDTILKNKVYLCERNRLRTTLKHFGASHLLRWLWHEIPHSAQYLATPSVRTVPLKAWTWNLCHLPSTVRWRTKLRKCRQPFDHLLDRSWGPYPPPTPNNQAFRPSIGDARSSLQVDGETELAQLVFGWYPTERDGARNFRWTEAHASALFAVGMGATTLRIEARAASAGQPYSLEIRPLGDPNACARINFTIPSIQWGNHEFKVEVKPGQYDVVLCAGKTYKDSLGRQLGLAISGIAFTSA